MQQLQMQFQFQRHTSAIGTITPKIKSKFTEAEICIKRLSNLHAIGKCPPQEKNGILGYINFLHLTIFPGVFGGLEADTFSSGDFGELEADTFEESGAFTADIWRVEHKSIYTKTSHNTSQTSRQKQVIPQSHVLQFP